MLPRMSNDPTASAEGHVAPQVAAVVSASDPAALRRCLAAIGEQVYEAARVFVVGGGDDIRHLSAEFDAMWRPNLRAAVSSIGPEVTFVWALREEAIPDRQALRILVQDSVRVDASVAGSKIVAADDPQRLVAVGYATDVFNAPYSGLQPDEVDQSQYDVIRDVAAVSGISVLIRRDLYQGLGGIDRSMAPTAAAIDFCQRARLRGARVVVIPGAIVALQGSDRAHDWRERAGEIRAMIKAYSPITLLWALPLTFLIGLIEGTAGILFGRFPLPGVIAAWLWNIPRLPTAIRQRFQARHGRERGDEELFRYQVAGSARMRALWDETLTRMRDRFPEGVLSGFAEAVEAGQQRIRHPAFFVGFLVVLFALVATREVWTEHLPVVGFSLPPPDSAVETLQAFGGGWNPAGLGSPEAMRPAVGAVALVQIVTFGSGGLAVAVIIVASFLAGSFGVGRLLRTWGIGSIAGYFAGTTMMAGPAIIAATGATHWTVIPAMAATPWAVRAAVVPWGAKPAERVARLCGATLAVGIVAVFTPVALVVPLMAVLLWALLGVGGRRVAATGKAALASVLALPLLVPWALYVDPIDLLENGSPAFWEPAWPAVAAVAATALGVVLAGDRTVSSVGAWGAVMAVLGAVAARSGDLGFGSEMLLAALVLNGLGVAVAAGAALEALTRRREFAGTHAAAALVAGAGALALIGGTLALAGPGRGGIPQDQLSGRFDFASPEGTAPSRILLFGAAGDLPGTSRDLDGFGYRVFVPPHPTSWEAHLNEERIGDRALQGVLEDIVAGRSRRAGAQLAAFGIGWVAFVEPSPLEQLFESQLDLVALRSLDFPVFRNEVAAAPAVASSGELWSPSGAGFASPTGAAGGDVFVATNADFRWGPGEWSQSDWGNQISEAGAEVSFATYGPRRMAAIGALLWLLVLTAGLAAPRFGRSRV